MTKFPKKSMDWRELATKECKGQSPDELTWQTPEGIPVKPLYTAEDLAGLAHLNACPASRPTFAAPRHDVRGPPLDRPAVRRLLHG